MFEFPRYRKNMSKTQPARGMRDFLPADVRKRNYVINIIREVYESYGFEPLETPAVENLETLTGKYGEEGNQLMFRILKRGEKLDVSQGEKGLSDLALRYDLTVPLARVVANYKNELPRFFKRYQIQPVWRADRPARGRFREFYQCDVDAIGSSSMIVEAELCAAFSEILERLGFDDFVILLNHREILRGMLEVANIVEAKQTDALVALDKFDKIGEQGVLKELIEREVGTEEKAKNLLSQFINLMKLHIMPVSDTPKNSTLEYEMRERSQANQVILEKLTDAIGENEFGKKGIESVKEILNLAENTAAFGRIRFQPNLARGLSYYTGAIFEIGLNRLDDKGNLQFSGSIGGGGRYDGLIGMFGKEQIPACGFSLGLERILVVMDERGMFEKPIAEGKLKLDSADVLIASFDEQLIGECLKLAGELREEDLRVLVYPEINQKGKPIKYAEQINVPFVCLVKENELAENKITLKNMLSGEQESISRSEIAAKIKL
jgi:histidyl-tRNA synthetase